MRRFCVRCGSEESSSNYIVDGLCMKCFMEVNNPFKKIGSIKIKYCGRCGAVHYSGKWIDLLENASSNIIREVMLKHLRLGDRVRVVDLSIDLHPYEDSSAKVRLLLEVENRFRFQYELPVQILWSRSVCPFCLRKAGGGYSSIIQIRYVNWSSEIPRLIEEVVNEYREYVADVEETRNGYDIKLVDSHIAKRIAEVVQRRWRNLRIVESYGDSRRLRDGSRFSKLYISIKILNFKKGDYIVLNGRPYTVVNVNENSITVSDQDGALHEIDVNELIVKYSKSRTKHDT